MTFDDYYASHWLPRGEYFAVHQLRFQTSWHYLQSLGLPDRGRVLDVAGSGPLSDYLRLAFGWQVVVTQSDLRHPLPLGDAAFDLIVCTETIEHIKDVESSALSDLERFNYSGVLTMLRELAKRLAPEGRLFITTPNANSYITLHKWLGGETLLLDPAHVREFTVADLSRVARESGLRCLQIQTKDCWPSNVGDQAAAAKLLLAPLLAQSAIERGDNIFAVFGRSPA